MGRYRKIEVKMWSDRNFNDLSPMKPSGQSLWFFLLTGPHTGPIPGLFRAGKAAMAEELGWSVEAFDKAFEEVFEKGMAKADFKSKLMWLPNAIKHNKPESPNVVLSWGKEFDMLPECELKDEILQELKILIYKLGESFKKAFDKAFGEALRQAVAKTMANQEQEQEQEQDLKRSCAEPKNLASTQQVESEEIIFIELISNTGDLVTVKNSKVTELEKLFPAVDVRQELRNMAAWLDGSPKNRKTVNGMMKFVSNWLIKQQNRGGGIRQPRDHLGVDDRSWANAMKAQAGG